MAIASPISNALRILLSAGESNGKDVIKSVSLSNVRTNADPDTLQATAEALAKLVAYPMVGIRRNAVDSIEE